MRLKAMRLKAMRLKLMRLKAIRFRYGLRLLKIVFTRVGSMELRF
jgi:hypothetical protein